MLQNFLDALALNGVQLKRVLLVTGAKQYGVHLGPVKCPLTESDPWVEGPGRPPNFYYTQQRILYAAAAEHHFDWLVTYPNDVIGVARGNFMNLSAALAIYAAVTKELGGELAYPGSEHFYNRFDSFTCSKLHAAFCAWAMREPRCANQAFNVTNGDSESWANLWPKVAAKFGLAVPSRQFERPAPDRSVMKLAAVPPYEDLARVTGMEGRVKPGEVEQRIDLTRWSQKEEVREAWGRIAAREGFEKDALEKATWAFLGFVLGRNYDVLISMSKARKYGWTGYVDTWEALEAAFDESAKEKIAPNGP
jgi:hypothetical protein